MQGTAVKKFAIQFLKGIGQLSVWQRQSPWSHSLWQTDGCDLLKMDITEFEKDSPNDQGIKITFSTRKGFLG